MSETQPSLFTADEIAQHPEFEVHHPLNPHSEVYLKSLSRLAGLRRVAVSLARIPPGKESFIYHAHSNEEEWLYILSGRGIAEIGETEQTVGPGDFLGFGLPQVAHHLRNPFEEELVYLVGGEIVSVDIGTFPRHGKRVIRDGETAHIIDDDSLQDFWTA